jgi:hypothetical protein
VGVVALVNEPKKKNWKPMFYRKTVGHPIKVYIKRSHIYHFKYLNHNVKGKRSRKTNKSALGQEGTTYTYLENLKLCIFVFNYNTSKG